MLLLLIGTTWLSAGFGRLSQASRRIADGDYATRLPASRVRELDEVSRPSTAWPRRCRRSSRSVRDNEQYLRRVIDTHVRRPGRDRPRAARDRLQRGDGAPGRHEHARPSSPPSRSRSGDADVPRPTAAPLPLEERPAALARAGHRRSRSATSLVRVERAERQPRMWVSVNATPLCRDGSGEPYAVFATMTDITRHVEAEQQLRDSQRGARAARARAHRRAAAGQGGGRARQPGQERVPLAHEPRAAHAAERDPRLRAAAGADAQDRRRPSASACARSRRPAGTCST